MFNITAQRDYKIPSEILWGRMKVLRFRMAIGLHPPQNPVLTMALTAIHRGKVRLSPPTQRGMVLHDKGPEKTRT